MKTTIIVAGVASLTSAIFGYFAGSMIKEKKLQKKVDADIAELRTYYESKKQNNVKVKQPDFDAKKVVEETKVEAKPANINAELNQILENYTSPEEFNPTSIKPARTTRRKKEEKAVSAITEITLEQFGCSEKPCETLKYYIDGTVVDGNGDVIDTPSEYIGAEGMSRCDAILSSNIGTYEDLYFRNENLGIDFEVVLTDDTYSE